MRIENEILLDYSDVLIRPKRSTLGSRKEVDLNREFNFVNYSNESENIHYYGIPIMGSNMDGVGTFKQADIMATGGLFTCLVKTYTSDELIAYFGEGISDRTSNVAMSIGIKDSDRNKFDIVYKEVGERLKYVCIDVANGYSERFVNYVKQFRSDYPHVVIIAGNVVTADQTQELILNGADIVKVGIGPGSVCTTRIQTGVGYPQLSAVIECADAAHGLGGHIIADGGCTCPGDVAKAFAAGADFVMLGGMLAGHDEGGGEVITQTFETGRAAQPPYPPEMPEDEVEKIKKQIASGEIEPPMRPVFEEKQFVKFYGMSSDAANQKHFGGLKDYRSSEGREVLVPYRGEVARTVQNILGGVRSTCTYVGAPTLKQLSKCTTFVRVNNQFNRTYESTTTKM
jgi:GMP reductase